MYIYVDYFKRLITVIIFINEQTIKDKEQWTVYRPRVSAHDLLGPVIWANACEFSIVIMIAHLQINKFKFKFSCREKLPKLSPQQFENRNKKSS